MNTKMKAVRKKVQAIDSAATGRKFRGIRKAAGFGLMEVATRMGISMTYLSELERGSRNWSETLVELFQHALSK